MEGVIKAVAVVGPTAVGKTAFGIEIAKKYRGEIVSADSMQIYRGLDIATAKPAEEEMREIPHHMINIIDLTESFSVADYVRLARLAVNDIRSRGKMPVIVGGTGLYISSLLDNIQFSEIKTDLALREELRRQAELYGQEYLLDKLREADPETASTLHVNNLPRIIRALEVYTLTGRKQSEMKLESRKNGSPYSVTYVGLTYSDREMLYDRINRRVDGMVKRGLIEECRRVYESNTGKGNGTGMRTCSQAIGYKELIPYFEGRADLSECIEKIKQETRRYAKRQMTWFRRNAQISWIMLDDFCEAVEILSEYEKIIAK